MIISLPVQTGCGIRPSIRDVGAPMTLIGRHVSVAGSYRPPFVWGFKNAKSVLLQPPHTIISLPVQTRRDSTLKSMPAIGRHSSVPPLPVGAELSPSDET